MRKVRVLTGQSPGEPRLVLREEGGIVEIVAGHAVLLSSAALETERAFGRLLPEITEDLGRPASRVLVGGLGFGATVRGVLDVLSSSAEVVVAERFAAVERLVRGELAGIAGAPLDDARVKVVIRDVAEVIASADRPFDAILLDVDNGPEWATLRENARLYTPAGLTCARAALSPGGVLAVWSGYPVDEFLPRLRAAGFGSRLIPLRERGRVRARAYVGVKPATPREA
jgi:spermidine synthase